MCCHSDRLQGCQVVMIIGWQVGTVARFNICKLAVWKDSDKLAG